MIRESVHAFLACLVTFALCAVAYPAAVYGVGHTLFPSQAEGSLIRRDGKVVGSMHIAQPFRSDRYFAPRPSAAGADGYATDAASGSNLAATNPALRERIAADAARQVAARAEAVGHAEADNPVPVDLVTASGSGLDPDLSPEAARYQAPRVAKARNLPVERILERIDARVDRSGAIFGAPPRVNVLLLNLDLDAMPSGSAARR
ncbi:potassium-transporting ATPase subunit KdpC [Tundrisphaera sp. TA3]|uniref:potassium-transporting ATPase subunit KdpC n=1 Tax=Tundrisphaera sp. TA3 TaxID=3435775 RepID=UPI003EB8C65E